MSSSLGDLIPLGKKPEKAKSDALTSGLISIGGSAATNNVEMDDFDLDDLLSDTPKPSSKGSKAANSPKKAKKSKDKKKKKDKSPSWDADDDDGDKMDFKHKSGFDFDEDIPKPKSSMKNLDEEFAKALGFQEDIPKPKTSMKNLDEEFAKALGFDDSEFQSSKLDSPVKGPSPEKPKEEEIPSKTMSASFFEDSTPSTTSFSRTRESSDRPKGRRSTLNDADIFGKQEVKPNADPFAKTAALFGNKEKEETESSKSKLNSLFDDKTSRKAQEEEPKPSKDMDLKPDKTDDIFGKKDFDQPDDSRESRGGRGRRRGGGGEKSDKTTDDTPSFPWMKGTKEQKEKTVPEDKKDDDMPAFPWMKKNSQPAPAEDVKLQEEVPPLKSSAKEPADELPAFPWVKKKTQDAAASPPEKPKPVAEAVDNDMPAFPWMKKQQQQPPVEKQTEPIQPPVEKLMREKSSPVPAPQPAQEPPTPPANSPPKVEKARNDDFQLDIPPRSISPSVPSNHNSPVKEPSPQRSTFTKQSPPIVTSNNPVEKPMTPPPPIETSKPSPEKVKAPSPPRPIFDDKSSKASSSPKRPSPTSRASFLNDESTIVPAFVTHQLEQSVEKVNNLTAQLNTATSQLSDMQIEYDKVKLQAADDAHEKDRLAVDNQTLRAQESTLREELSRAIAESAQWQEKVTSLTQEKQTLGQEVTALRIQASDLSVLQALVKELQLENNSLRGQLSSLQATFATCQRDLVKEQSLHAQNVERFQRMQHDREQEALQQQRWQAQEQRHAEKEALERLLTQVRAAVLQESVVGGKSEMDMRLVGENETRARLLLDMEGSCKAYMNRSQEECHRLQALLSTMETTMRTLRGEHMEEKERLRLEQSRLDELALHFQSQTTLLQERTDSNTRVVTQTLSTPMFPNVHFTTRLVGAYIQDIHVAETRLHTRREQLMEEERQLHLARAAFAAQQEEALREQRLSQDKLHREQKRVEDKLHRVRQETQAFEQMVHNHASEMEALAELQMQLDSEKQRLREAAARIEAMAEKVREASEHSAAMEYEAKETMREAAALVSQVQDERSRVQKHAAQLEEREKRLHEQVRYMETNRRTRLVEERTNIKRVVAKKSFEPFVVVPKPNNQMQWTPPPAPSLPKQGVTTEWRDPSGLSPSFRREMEQFWTHGNQVQSEDLRKRMLLSCVGLPMAKTTFQPNPASARPVTQRVDPKSSFML
ncbi:unnamed protein product [Aphanomyces euteiches]|uniref:Uncharacterized protein n=1 Tax=Aphanomyces euteiches TaxID=100861 RepID=A0A6G0WIB9_9STRA|nr:hypothetical protein Ae201684_014926 [Aphanomyces euteiches]